MGQSGLSTQVSCCCASSPRAGRLSKWLYGIPAAKGAANPQVTEGGFRITSGCLSRAPWGALPPDPNLALVEVEILVADTHDLPHPGASVD
jgi:hypothetical protein